MRKLPTRQVHLDFHTSPFIPDVGKQFDKKQFQQALIEGNLNSITVFAKCHHGYCYFPTKVGTQHPTMEPGFDLTGAMVDAAHEIGVDAPIYITAGWSVKDAEEHPQWCMCNKDGSKRTNEFDPNALPTDPRPACSWDHLCLTGDYAQHIYDLTREVCDRYEKVDGLFFDIVYLKDTCYCPSCVAGMKKAGLDPDNIEDARNWYRKTHLEFMENCKKILHEKHPDATIFFNSGGADIYRPEYHAGQTHYEMEDLPTTWGGYNKMPPRASVMSRYGKDYLGMTGKFHTSWGEFGGYKNPDALKYEVLMMAMFGAKCSVGDQMPPSGKMDMETYKLIGKAYRALQRIEPWSYPAAPTADVGVYLSGNEDSDEGLHAMLLESHIDFEIVMPGDDLSPYNALILPDCVKPSDTEAQRIAHFAAQNKAVLFTGTSAVKDGKFQLDCGAEYIGNAAFRQDYFCPTESLPLPFGNAPFLCYRAGERVSPKDGHIMAQVYEPWFDRTYEKYCSHQNTPYRGEPASHPAAIRKHKTVYLAHPLCAMYKVDGAQLFREALIAALKTVYTPKYTISMPSAGRTRLTYQAEQNRCVFHAAYASPITRGRTQVIEDIVPLYQVPVSVQTEKPVKCVKLVPDGSELPFTQKDGVLSFVIPCVNCHQAVEIDL